MPKLPRDVRQEEDLTEHDFQNIRYGVSRGTSITELHQNSKSMRDLSRLGSSQSQKRSCGRIHKSLFRVIFVIANALLNDKRD